MIRCLVALLAVLAVLPHAAARATEPSVAAIVTPAEGQVLRGRFVQERHLEGFRAPLLTEGRFLLVPDRGLIWWADRPFALVTVIGPGGLAQGRQDAETLTVMGGQVPGIERLYAMLGAALTGDWQGMDELFLVRRDADPGQWRLRLTPIDRTEAGLPVREISISGGSAVDEIEIIKPAGDRDRILFRDQVLSAEPPTDREARLLDAVAGR